MLKPRYGVLEIVNITDDRATVQCLAHPNHPPFTLILQQLQDGAKRCPACAADAAGQRRNAADYTGQRFGDWIAVKNIGLSTNAATIRGKQQQWQSNSPFGLRSYCRAKYWLCYCVHCHTERKIRGDVLRSGKLPGCGCRKEKT